MVVRSPKGDKNTRGKILLKFSVYYSIFKTLFWFFILVFEQLFSAAFENYFFFFPLVGGREKSLVMSYLQLFRVTRVSCYTVLWSTCVPAHKLLDGAGKQRSSGSYCIAI